MAGGSRDLRYNVTVDASDASSSLKKLASDVKKTGKDIESGLDDSASAGDRFKATIDELSGKLETEFKSAAKAADKLGTALKEAGSEMNVSDAIADLTRMGFTFQEITADADKFAGSLKQLDDVKIAGVKELDSVAPGLATKLDEVDKSAGSSKSALANMVGNSAQDLGNLGGIAGSTGVLIGQMAEYMADASFEGEGFASVLKNFAAVAGPAAALGLVIATVTGFMEKQAEEAKVAAERNKELGDAMAGAADDAVGITDALKNNLDPLRDFDAGLALLGSSSAKTVNDIGRSIPLIGRIFEDTSRDIVDALSDGQASIYDFGKAVSGSDEDAFAFVLRMRTLVSLGAITEDQFLAITGALDEYRASAKKAEQAQGLLNVTADDANSIFGELVTKADPMAKFGDVWATLMQDMADGSIDTEDAANSINFLADKLGLTREEVISLAKEHLDKTMQDAADATVEAAKASSEAAAEMDKYKRAVGEASVAVADMDSALSGIGRRHDALAGIFKLDTGPRDARSNLRDVGKGIDELSDKLKGVKVGDVLRNSIKADDFLDAIDSVAPQIQEAIADAFSSPTGGAEAAAQMANSYIDQVTKELGGKFSRDQVAKMLGLDNITATIKAGVDATAAARAREKLAILTGLTGESTLTATLKLALDAGTLTAQQVEAYTDQILGGQGVKVPGTIQLPQDQADQLVAFLKSMNLPVPTSLALPQPFDPGALDPVMTDAIISTSYASPTPFPPETLTATAGPVPIATVLETPDLGPWAAADAGSLGVDIPTLSVPVTADTKPADTAVADFTKEDRETNVDVNVDTAQASTDIVNFVARPRSTTVDVAADTSDFLRDGDAARTRIGKPLTVSVKYVSDGTVHAGGGTVGRSGGIGGEAGPEFVTTPAGVTSLINGPTVLAPGTKVTSVRRTRQILRGRVPKYAKGTGVELPARARPISIGVDTRTAERQIAALLRPRPVRIQAQVIPSNVLVRVNGGG